jgi:hypothetical protein
MMESHSKFTRIDAHYVGRCMEMIAESVRRKSFTGTTNHGKGGNSSLAKRLGYALTHQTFAEDISPNAIIH